MLPYIITYDFMLLLYMQKIIYGYDIHCVYTHINVTCSRLDWDNNILQIKLSDKKYNIFIVCENEREHCTWQGMFCICVCGKSGSILFVYTAMSYIYI